MDSQHLKRVLQSAAAGSILLLSANSNAGDCLFKHTPDRPQVSPACLPAWGYHQTCWRQFGPVQSCDLYSTGIARQMQVMSDPGMNGPPQPGFVYSYPRPSVNKPLSVLPNSGSINTQPGADPASVPGVVPSTMVPPTGTSLPPLPSNLPPIAPVPDPGAQQSRYSRPQLWIPQQQILNSSGRRYGQVPVQTISASRIVTSERVEPLIQNPFDIRPLRSAP